MKTKCIYLFLIVLFLGGTPSCSDDNSIDNSSLIIGLGGDSYPENDIDKWLHKEFVKPFNINVKYRWNPFDASLTSCITPIEENRVIPVMELIRDVWINPYIKSKDSLFIKNYAPKNYVLFGSPKYNSNGTITLGEAEGGNRVTLYRLNQWNPKKPDKTLAQRILKTIHHEFTHTMNQIARYQEEFMKVTPSGYTSSWTNLKDTVARDMGFISTYAADSPGEDFAEMVSIILVYGKETFEARIAAATNETAKAALRQKETMVVEYLQQYWGITFYGTHDSPGLYDFTQKALGNYLIQFQ